VADLETGDHARDPAARLVSTKVLHEYPIGVRTLEEAARLLRVPLAEVALASITVTPWQGAEPGVTFWSVRQLARNVVLNRRARRQKLPATITKPVTGGTLPPLRRLDPELAEVAAQVAARIGVQPVAEQFGIAPSTLFNAWARFGTERPSKRLPLDQRPHNRRKLTREKVLEAAELAREIGVPMAAEHYGVTARGLRLAADRHAIDLPRQRQPKKAA
jgi:antitoxin component of RelBE/YafQ-DinJ toxin-antitoxin module